MTTEITDLNRRIRELDAKIRDPVTPLAPDLRATLAAAICR